MKPVFQTRFGNDLEAPGNCFSACVASILECTLEDLPDEAAIVAELKQRDVKEWQSLSNERRRGKSWNELWDRTQAVCARRGFWMLEVKGPWMTWPLDSWCIISGDSPRGSFLHSTVGFGNKIRHDPHPSCDGLRNEPEWTFIFFVLVDPAQVPA